MYKKFAWALGIAASLSVAIFFSGTAYGLTDTSPENTDSTGVWHMIAWHYSNDGYSMKLGAYYDSWPSGGRITITKAPDGGPTPGGGAWLPACYDMMGDIYTSPTMTFAQVIMQGMEGDTPVSGTSRTYNIQRQNFCAAPAHNEASFFGTFDIPTTAPPRDPLTDKFKMEITVRLHSNVANATYQPYSAQAIFSVTANTAGALVGPTAGQDIGSRSYQNTGYRAHRMYFGSDCSIDTTQWRTIRLTDPDNYSSPGIISGTQGNGDDGDTGRELVFYVEKRPTTSSGSYTRLTSAEYQTTSTSYVKIDDSAGYRRWIPTGTQDAGGRSQDSVLNIRMEPDMAYRLFISQVNWKNVLQIQIPTDSVYHDVECPDDDTVIVPATTLTGSPVMVANPINASFQVRNNGSYYDTSVSYETRVFVDENRNSSWDPGLDISKNLFTKTITMAPGAVDTPPSWNDPVAALANYGSSGRVCAYTRIISTSRGTATPQIDMKCADIGKVPKLHVRNGDITVGGATTGTNCTVNADIAILQGIDNAQGESKGEFGVLALGNIYSFGSNNFGSLSTASRTLTFANTPSLGQFNGTGTVQYCMHTPFAPGLFEDSVPIGSHPATTMPGSIYNFGTAGSTITIPKNTSYILRSPGPTVKILSNVQFQDTTYNSPREIPRFAILTPGAIFLEGSVNRLDGIYASNGRFISCFDTPYWVGLNDCNEQLTINGAVFVGPGSGFMAWRTAGASETSLNTPAELLNLHPATILSEHQPPGSALKTTVIEELPPRF